MPVRAEGRVLLACLFLLFPACSFLNASRRPPRAPPEEAARVTFPLDMHTHERVVLSGGRVTAMELALGDFLPLDVNRTSASPTTSSHPPGHRG